MVLAPGFRFSVFGFKISVVLILNSVNLCAPFLKSSSIPPIHFASQDQLDLHILHRPPEWLFGTGG